MLVKTGSKTALSCKSSKFSKKFAKSIGFLSEMCYNGKANYSITINFKGDTNYGE
jgi:hypothetical protein